jgi:S-DNA-T family DNA segregation ATPase FtsK/SpoIIIE
MKWTVYLRPTEHRRVNEFVGLILVTIAVLMALSLISFNAADPSLNISSNPAFQNRPANLIGVVGSYVADFFFQSFGLASFLLPVFLGIYAFHWLASWTVKNVGPRLTGMALMIMTASAAFSMSPLPRIDQQIPAGGGGGELLADWLSATFNPLGAVIVLLSSFLVSLLLATTFSLVRTSDAIKPRLAFINQWRHQLIASWEERGKERARRRIQKKYAAMAATPEEVPQRKEQTIHSIKEPPKAARARAKPKELELFEDPLVPIDEPVVTEMSDVPLNEVAFPSPELLLPPEEQIEFSEEALRERADLVEAKAMEFEVAGQVQKIHPGPVVTTFEFKPEAGIKYSKVTGLADDLCLALEAESIRIDRIPGKSTVGMEVPNPERATIMLRELLESNEYLESKALLPLALGKDIRGNIVVADLHRMPHLLIAGSTGTGKSVSVNALILSLLFRAKPDRVKLIMIDPKRLELGLYQDIPHLLVPVVTEPIQATNALKWAVSEMEGRYKKLARRSVRTLEAYNEQIRQLPPPAMDEQDKEDDRTGLPYIVIVIDELADLMMVAPKDVETCITRLAQMARAVGIHLVLATQRPSVDVITGLIKANFPARISFRVASKVDSRTILDANGAESLLGRGDMLFLPPGSSRLMRAHGPMVTEEEVTRVADYLKAQGKPAYNESILELPEERRAPEADGSNDALYEDAARLVVDMGKASTSALQRRLRIGYGRAASLLDAMEADGIVGPPDGSRPREVLVKPDFFEEFDDRDPEE